MEGYLQRKYSNSVADTPMGDFGELNRPQPLEETFEEVNDFIQKARAKSTPGINGIMYKLYKRCLKVLASLWKFLQVTHIKKLIAED